jgi:hypothetical protein
MDVKNICCRNGCNNAKLEMLPPHNTDTRAAAMHLLVTLQALFITFITPTFNHEINRDSHYPPKATPGANIM